MKTLHRALAMALAVAMVVSAQGNQFDRVRYNGGTVATKVDPHDWHNHLTVTSDLITFKLKDGQAVEINPKSVTGLSYGQEAHRRVGTMIVLGILVAPAALFGLFHKTRLHYMGVEYKTAENKPAGLLLQGDKDNYRAILVALQSVSGVAVSVSEQDRAFIPVGVTTAVAKGTEAPQTPSSQQQPAWQQQLATQGTSSSQESAKSKADEQTGVVKITCAPSDGEVFVDGAYVGSTPTTLKLSAGKHTVRVSLAGYKDWIREVTVLAGSELNLTAKPEK